MPSLAERPQEKLEERFITLPGFDWEHFIRLCDSLEEVSGARVTYLDGVVQIMSPIGEEHESVKGTLSLLLETYLLARDIWFYRRGSATLQQFGYASGEPDESYHIGSRKEVPDLVIEVVVSSGLKNKLALYRSKQIPEVWLWEKEHLQVLCLRDGEYIESNHSGLLPELDMQTVAGYLTWPDQYSAVRDFQRSLRDIDFQKNT